MDGFVQVINDIVRMGKDLSCEAFRVYCVIKSYNPSFPSYSKLEQDCGLGRKCIAKVIKELVEKGLISYAKGNSARKCNVYRILESTSFPGKLVSKGNQFPRETRTSIRRKLELVSQGNSKKNNVKITIKKEQYICDPVSSFPEKEILDKKESKLSPEALKNLWNENCNAMPKIIAMGEGRKNLIKQKLKEFPDFEFWEKSMMKIKHSPFCNGTNQSSWTATFDWWIGNDKKSKAANALKCNEGNYDDKAQLQRNYEQEKYERGLREKEEKNRIENERIAKDFEGFVLEKN